MREQAELTWYLSRGLSIFQRSTTGAILEKLEMESCVSRKCRRCNGQGIIDEPYNAPDPKDPSRMIRIESGAWCGKCKGSGAEPVRLSEEEKRRVDSGDTVRRDNEGTRSQVPDEVLVRFAYVSRLLSALPMTTRLVIEAAYGDEGEELSHGLKGRAWAVTPLTKAGRELLAQERDRKETAGVERPERPVQCLVSLADLPKNEKHPERTRLLAEAAHHAEKMLAEAEAVWDVIVGGLTEREAAQ